MEFRWNDWNIEHVQEHGVSPEEAEDLLREGHATLPVSYGGGKKVVWGRGWGGRLLQVVFVPDDEETAYVIHARPLTESEKRRYRRRTR